VRGGVATQITKDQSLMQRLVDAGELTEEEAEHSERRNIILQALGPDPRIKVDLTWQELHQGDTLVLCSDGLSGQVRREEIGHLVNDEPDLDALCTRLITLANERGGPDNITAIVARFDGAGLPATGTAGEVGYHTLVSADANSDETPLPAAPVLVPVQPEIPEVAPPTPLVRRTGSPMTIALIGGGLLLFLLILILLLKR
jgi:protein phosphatase